MKIIIISPSKKEDKANELQVLISLFENGLNTYHLRKPKLSTKELGEYLRRIPAQFHNRIVIHSHHNLAIKFNLKGVHYTKSHLKKNFKNWWREKTLGIAKSNLIKSVSHTKLVSVYDNNDMNFNYEFLSPIFDSLTGKYQSGFYEEGIKAAIQKTGKRLIARGGADITRIEKVKELGFYGMALYSCIWDSDSPVEEYIKIVKRCNELGIPIE
ncbi:MAG: thiamine phosphate synthase [Bacteroidia bacterium]